MFQLGTIIIAYNKIKFKSHWREIDNYIDNLYYIKNLVSGLL